MILTAKYWADMSDRQQLTMNLLFFLVALPELPGLALWGRWQLFTCKKHTVNRKVESVGVTLVNSAQGTVKFSIITTGHSLGNDDDEFLKRCF